jgi:hypothetical protein
MRRKPLQMIRQSKQSRVTHRRQKLLSAIHLAAAIASGYE